MKNIRQLAVFTLLAVVSMFAISAHAGAQNNRITVSSMFTKDGGAMTAECRSEAMAFMAIAKNYPQPSNWHFIIICDEPSWQDWIQKSGQYRQGVEVYGTTYLKDRVTYIRGPKLIHPDDTSGVPSPARIVAHELAHVILNTMDDDKAESQAVIWMRQASAPVNVIAEAPAMEQSNKK